MTDKEKIIIDDVDVSECKFLVNRFSNNTDYCCSELNNTLLKCPKRDCYFKQLQKEKFENLNNRQMVKNAENLIYENSELYKNLKEKEQECEELRVAYNKAQDILGRVNRANELKSYSLEESIKENVCHRNALEKIENNINKYFEESFYKNCRYAKGCTNACGLATNSVLNQILNIINKAKGE